jgi:hypothetical protein
MRNLYGSAIDYTSLKVKGDHPGIQLLNPDEDYFENTSVKRKRQQHSSKKCNSCSLKMSADLQCLLSKLVVDLQHTNGISTLAIVL